MTFDEYIVFIQDRRDNTWRLDRSNSLTGARKSLPRYDDKAGEYHSFWTVRWATKEDVANAKRAGKAVPAAYIKG